MNRKVYQAGLKFMLCNAVKKLYNGEVIFHHGLDHGIYSEIICDELIDIQELKRIKKSKKFFSTFCTNQNDLFFLEAG